MKKNVIRAIVLIAVFFGTIFGFGAINTQTNEDLTKDMAQATMPVVYLYHENTKINELHGYTMEMDAAYMRDSITPVSEENHIPMEIATHSQTITGISYQIRSLDLEELLVDTEISEFSQEKGMIRTDIPIQSIVDEETEYQLILNLEAGEKTYRYYTRIIKPVNCYVADTLGFAVEFHNASMNKDTYETLATYMEPNSSGDNTTLHKVTIHSSLKQLGWGDMQVETILAPVPRFVEINTSYSVIMMDYVVSSVTEDGGLEYYNIEEYYRVRHTSDRDYLLNFERTMNQIYRAESAVFQEQLIELGISGTDVAYKSNETGSTVAFVHEGELWCYHNESGNLCQVFSFRGFEGIDSRENYNQHDIRIIDVDESGSVNFVVYGYMNRGDHEGEVGTGIYHYDCVANTVEEEAFLPSDKSYEVMKSDIGDLLYESDAGIFYVMLEDTIYAVNLTDRTVRTVLDGLNEETYSVSESNRYIAYQSDGTGNASAAITVYDFEDNTTYEIVADSNEYLKPLGFMEEDFIYGAARKSDIMTDGAGNETFPMYKVTILSTAKTHDILKEYEKEGYFISDITVDNYTIYLNRITYNGVAYEDAQQDTIMNREGESMKLVTLETIKDDVKQTEVAINIGANISNQSPKILTPREVVVEGDHVVEIQTSQLGEKYYVYAQGRVFLSTYQLPDAVLSANENMGVVVGDGQRYLWMRARKNTKSAIAVTVSEDDAASGSIAQCVNAVLETRGINIGVQSLIDRGNSAKEILANSLREVTFIDLTGCSVDETLYYISKGAPVFAMSDPNTAVLLVGYDSGNVIIYDTSLGQNYKMSFSDAETYFAEAGNVFFTYIE